MISYRLILGTDQSYPLPVGYVISTMRNQISTEYPLLLPELPCAIMTKLCATGATAQLYS
jgi:hypothetical protein